MTGHYWTGHYWPADRYPIPMTVPWPFVQFHGTWNDKLGKYVHLLDGHHHSEGNVDYFHSSMLDALSDYILSKIVALCDTDILVLYDLLLRGNGSR